jgi:photosystem II stability/assembly factor-like uncharacterized protein
MRKTPKNGLWKALSVIFICASLIQSSAILIIQPATALAPMESVNVVASSAKQQDDIENNIYLPTVSQPARVELNEVWTADGTGTNVEAFLPGKVIRYYGRGYVNLQDGILVNLRWSLFGPCGSKTLANENIQLDQGSWLLYRTDVAPDCPGIYVYTLRMAYDDKVSFLTVPYVINNPSEISTVSLPGFDKCNIPYGSTEESIAQMQTWWNLSPYYITNLYIGGVSRGCSNTELDAVWVNLAAKQGWSFIPTWVGPQAPCTSYKNKFSYDLDTAYLQGVSEANASVTAARDLGFLGNAVIYYDLETYSTTNLECREAVKSFLTGWTKRIKEYGLRSGVYGHRINANDWAVIYPVPDNAWIAYWVYPFAYNPYASPYGIPGVSDDLWYGHRIRQYTGGHVETYGGLSFNIDSNIAHGDVTVLANTVLSSSGDLFTAASGERKATEQDLILATRSQVQDIQLISKQTGWGLVDNNLFWTDDEGSTWSEMTPPKTNNETVLAAHFQDDSNGWSVSQDSLTGQLNVYQTNDKGVNWLVSSLQEGDLSLGPLVSKVYMDFLDTQNGWIVVKFVSSSNFSVGKLYRTNDGGETWEELSIPMGEPVRFLDKNRGWIAGGPAGDDLYRSEDGGISWQQEEFYSLITQQAEHALVELPVFADERNGILPVKVINDGASQVEILSTHDGGVTWENNSPTFLRVTGSAGDGLILSYLGESRFFLASENSQSILLDSASAGITASAADPLAISLVKVQFTSNGEGWAIAQGGDCSGAKPGSVDAVLAKYIGFQCESRTQILRTTNYGKTWAEITPKP